MIKIKFVDGKQSLEIDAETISAAVQNAVKSGADLRGANLSRADLSRADLSGANLSGASLSRADLSGADLSGADWSGADLRGADLSGADLSGADLRGADLSGADLSRADLRGANLSRADFDFSCWPLWCGSLNVKIDKRIFCQLIYHALRAGQSVDDPEVKRLFEIPEIVNLANQFHRSEECGKIEERGSANATLHN